MQIRISATPLFRETFSWSVVMCADDRTGVHPWRQQSSRGTPDARSHLAERYLGPPRCHFSDAPEASLRLILCAPSIGKVNASFPPAVVGGAHEVAIAPLRERKDEIPQLIDYWLVSVRSRLRFAALTEPAQQSSTGTTNARARDGCATRHDARESRQGLQRLPGSSGSASPRHHPFGNNMYVHSTAIRDALKKTGSITERRRCSASPECRCPVGASAECCMPASEHRQRRGRAPHPKDRSHLDERYRVAVVS